MAWSVALVTAETTTQVVSITVTQLTHKEQDTSISHTHRSPLWSRFPHHDGDYLTLETGQHPTVILRALAVIETVELIDFESLTS